MLLTDNNAAAVAAGAGRMASTVWVMCDSSDCRHPPCAQLRTGAGDPVFQRRLSSTEKPRRTGSPAFAGDDICVLGCCRAATSTIHQPSHSGLRGRSTVFTFSSLIVPLLM